MKKITELIDASLSSSEFGKYKKIFFGLSEIVTKGTQHYPVTIPDRKQVALDNTKDLITWMRLPDEITSDVVEDLSFGKNEAVEYTASIRLVVAIKSSFGEEMIFKIANAIPNKYKNPDFKYIFVTKGNINTDHEAIYLEELDETQYEKHRLTWNLYVININTEFILCT